MKKIISIEFECEEEDVGELEERLMEFAFGIESLRLGDELGIEIKDADPE